MSFWIFTLIFLILVLVLGWHIVFAILGGAIVVGAAAWGMVILGIVFFCIAALIAFFLTSFLGVILGIVFAVWTLIAVLLFPILFPILLPLFIIYAFIVYMRRKKKIVD